MSTSDWELQGFHEKVGFAAKHIFMTDHDAPKLEVRHIPLHCEKKREKKV